MAHHFLMFWYYKEKHFIASPKKNKVFVGILVICLHFYYRINNKHMKTLLCIKEHFIVMRSKQ
jgi:hypothetical protein